MPFRLNEFRAKIQFMTSAETPRLVYKACLKTGTPSNTAYIQRAVAEALSRDLGIPLEDLLANLPPTRGSASTLFGMDRKPISMRISAANTVEEVR